MKMHSISEKKIDQVIDLAYKYEEKRDLEVVEDVICQEIGIPGTYTRKYLKAKIGPNGRMKRYKELLHIIKVRKRWLCDIFNLPHWMNLDDIIEDIREKVTWKKYKKLKFAIDVDISSTIFVETWGKGVSL